MTRRRDRNLIALFLYCGFSLCGRHVSVNVALNPRVLVAEPLGSHMLPLISFCIPLLCTSVRAVDACQCHAGLEQPRQTTAAAAATGTGASSVPERRKTTFCRPRLKWTPQQAPLKSALQPNRLYILFDIVVEFLSTWFER